MENYKKKTLSFSHNRELRAFRRSIDRRNIKHVRLSALRGIDENHVESSFTEKEEIKVESIPQQVEKKQTVVKAKSIQKTNPRAEMLKKWKEEKELRQRFQMKKPAFVVKHVTYEKPPSLLPKNTDGKKNESKMLCRSLCTSRIAFPKARNLQVTPCLPKSKPSSLVFPQSTATKTSFNQVNSKLPTGKQAMSKRLPTVPKPNFKPQNQGSQQNTQSLKKVIPAVSRTGATHGNKPSLFSQSSASIVKPMFNKPQAPSVKPSGIGKATVPKSPLVKNSTVPKTPNGARFPRSFQSNNPKAQTLSFAPKHFVFKAPVNVEKFIFPNGVPSASSKKESSTEKIESEGPSVNKLLENTSDDNLAKECMQKSSLSCDGCNSGDDEHAIQPSTWKSNGEVVQMNSSVPEKSNAEIFKSEDVASQYQLVEKFGVNDIETKENEEFFRSQSAKDGQSQLSEKTSDVKDISTTSSDQKQTEVMEDTVSIDDKTEDSIKTYEAPLDKSLESDDKCSAPVKPTEPAQAQKENEPPSTETYSTLASTKPVLHSIINGNSNIVVGNGKLHPIIEDLEICDTLSTGKNKYASQGALTPRRSRRLASLHEKMNGLIAKEEKKSVQLIPNDSDAPASGKQSPLPCHCDLAEEMSALSVNGTAGNQQVNIKVKQEIKQPALPILNENSSGLTPVHPRRLRSSVKKEMIQGCPGIETFQFIKDDAPGTPNRPLTRQQRKISLLGSPQVPSNLPRKSIRGDLITFSPVS